MKGRRGVGPRDPMSFKGNTPTQRQSIAAAYGQSGGGKTAAQIEGPLTHKRFDRPGRKVGGRVGADKAPLSSAASSKAASGHETDC